MNNPSEYLEKLKDPRWQKKRLEILERDAWTCQSCSDKTSTLHVHHLWYEDDVEPWDYPLGCFETLCEDCHVECAPKGINLNRIQRSLRGICKVAIDVDVFVKLMDVYDEKYPDFKNPIRVAVSENLRSFPSRTTVEKT